MNWDPEVLGCVVVGIDENHLAADLLVAAAEEAQRRETSLAVVTVAQGPRPFKGLSNSFTRAEQATARSRRLITCIDTLRTDRPGLTVTVVRLEADRIGANTEPLASADLLVVGTQGADGAPAFGPQTISWQLMWTARCPVLAIPDRPSAGTRQQSGLPPVVLAGLSGKRSDPVVLTTATVEARRRHADLQLLHAYTLHSRETAEQGLLRAMEMITRAVRATPPAPGIRMSVLLTQEDPGSALCRQGSGAAVLVMAARSASIAGMTDNAVSHNVMAAAPCPVLVVPWLLIDSRHPKWARAEPAAATRPGGSQ